MTLYKVICEGVLGQNIEGAPPEGYVLHVLAESPESAARKARATGHTVRTVCQEALTDCTHKVGA